jgi:hypothetical protein
MISDNIINNKCPICHETILDKDNCITDCDHKFCLSCILESCKYKNTCPICRVQLYEYNINNEDENDQPQNEIVPTEIENEILLRIMNIILNNVNIRNNSHEFIIYNNYLRYAHTLSNLSYNFFINPIKYGLKYFINVTAFTMLSSLGLYTGFYYANKFISYFS